MKDENTRAELLRGPEPLRAPVGGPVRSADPSGRERWPIAARGAVAGPPMTDAATERSFGYGNVPGLLQLLAPAAARAKLG